MPSTGAAACSSTCDTTRHGVRYFGSIDLARAYAMADDEDVKAGNPADGVRRLDLLRLRKTKIFHTVKKLVLYPRARDCTQLGATTRR